MKNIFRKSLAAICLFSATTSFAALDPTHEFVQKLDQIKSMQGKFTQKQVDKNNNPIYSSNGTFAAHRPGHFRWQTLAPTPQLIVADGKKLWVYDTDLAQVSVSPQKQNVASAPAELLSGDPKVVIRQFKVDSLKNENGLEVFTLTARDPDIPVVSVQFSFARTAPLRMALVDHMEQTTIIDFKQIKINQPVASALFHFKPPAGTDVIEQPES